MNIKRGDWVRIRGYPDTWRGTVRRIARDGSWADVAWADGGSKRMPAASLEPLHTIQVGDWEITDETRKRELEDEAGR